MSLSCLAAQLCAVGALKGKTRAGDNVRDSEAGLIVIDEDGSLETPQEKPFVNVWSDDQQGEDSRNDLLGASKLTMTIEFGVTASMPIILPNGQLLIDPETEAPAVVLHSTLVDAQLNMLLEVIDRQVRVALSSDDPWANCWRDFMCMPYSVVSRRGGNESGGTRFAARQLQIMATLAADPPSKGALPDAGRWKTFLDLLGSTSDMAHLVPMFENLMGVNDTDYDFNETIQRYAMRQRQATNLGLMPKYASKPDAKIGAENILKNEADQ